MSNYQKRLKILSEDKTSSLHDFTKFFQNGTSLLEGLTIQSLKQDIRRHFETLFRVNFEDEEQWKKFSNFDEVTQSQTFDPTKLTYHFKYQHKFLVAMAQTQLFAAFLQKRKEPVIMHEIRAALFIAEWLSFKWKYAGETKSAST